MRDILVHRRDHLLQPSILRSFLMFKKLLAFVATMYVALAFAAVDVNTATTAENFYMRQTAIIQNIF